MEANEKKDATTPTKRRPQPLVVLDGRSSYINRIETLAGPGAYVIPSTFERPLYNTKINQIRFTSYGREFARQQRQVNTLVVPEHEADQSSASHCTETPSTLKPDKYQHRREQLRTYLKHDEEQGADDVMAVHDIELDIPASPSTSIPSNCEEFVRGYRSATSASNLGTRTSNGVPHHGMTRMPYKQYLRSTSYSKRMLKHSLRPHGSFK